MPNTGAIPKLVLFDADGVLVDSERPSTRVLAECVSELGRPTTTDDVVQHLMGVNLDDMTRIVAEWVGHDVPEGWLDGFRDRRREAFEREIKPIEGVEAAIDALVEAGVALCCVTNGPLEKVTQTLRVSGLAHLFEPAESRVFSAYEVGIFKPDPGLHLHAAKRFGVSPESCVVIDDTRQGAAGGVNAGMRTLGFADLAPRAWFDELGIESFGSMNELPAMLGLPARSTLPS